MIKLSWLKHNSPHLLGLLSVITLALILRLIHLTTLPNGLNWDETAYGYNAFSLRQTGRDEWAQPWPLFLKSFGEYKPALLSYLLIPFLTLTPDWNWNIRLVAVMLGCLSIVATYGLAWRLHKSIPVSILTSLMVAIMPWHVHYSRTVMDPIVGLFFLMTGAWAWQSSHKHHRFLGSLFLILSMYAYNAERVFVPLFFGGWWLWSERSNFKQFIKNNWINLSVLILGTFALWHETLVGQGGTRARTMVGDSINVSEVLVRYLNHFNPRFLFLAQDPIRTGWGYTEYGYILLVLAPFLVIGLLYAFFEIFHKKNFAHNNLQIFWLWWLMVSPIASALTIDSPHPGRALTMVPALAFFMAQGLWLCWNFFQYQWLKYGLGSLVILIIFTNGLWYISQYLERYPYLSETHFQGQYKDLVMYLYEQRTEFDHVILNTSADTPLLFYAWYNHLDPRFIQTARTRVQALSYLENVVIASAPPLCTLTTPNSLVVLTPDQLPPQPIPIAQRFFFHNSHNVTFVVINTNQLTREEINHFQLECGSSN